MKCNHANGELIEYVQAANIKDVQNGKLSEIGVNEISEIIGYEYKCYDCLKTWKFSSSNNKLPLWLKKICNQI